MVAMLRKEACSGHTDDLSHVISEHCVSDCLTKANAKAESLVNAINTGNLPGIDLHPSFRSLLQHRAYLSQWIVRNIDHSRDVVYFMCIHVRPAIETYFALDKDERERLTDEPSEH